MTSQVHQFHLGTSCDVFAMSQARQFHLGNSWYVPMTYQIGRFYLGTSETSSQRPKKVHLKKVRFVITSKCGPRRLNLNEIKMRRRYNIACRVGTFHC